MTEKEMVKELLEQLQSPMDVFLRIEKLNLLRYLCVKGNRVKLLKSTCVALIDVINNHLFKLPKDQQLKTYNILRDTYTTYARYNFEAFLIAMEWARPVERRFYQPRMKVLRPVVEDLQALDDGEVDIYILSMPPRVGKSTIGLFYLAWTAGKYPNETIFGVGYSSGLVKTFYNGVLDFIDSLEYRFYEIFPEAKGRLSTSAEDRTIDIWKSERYKTLTFRSIDGQITGALEAKALVYMDDMCSGIEEAMKIERLDKLWDKVSIDVRQRGVQNPRRGVGRKAPILMIGTIWSLHDPINRLKRLYADNPRLRERVMPALNEDMQSNFNYEMGVGFTTEMYLDLKRGMDEISFECVYQQNPMERDGLAFPVDSLKRYLQLPPTTPDAIIAFCDVAFGGDDYLSFPIAYMYGTDVYIVDVVCRKRADYHVTQPLVVGKILSHGVQIAHFEANNGGDFYARDVDDMVRSQSDHRCNITATKAGTSQSKLTRILQYKPDILNFYFKDMELYKPSDDYGRFMINLTTFVETGENRNDDAPDSLAGLAQNLKIPRIATITSKNGIRSCL